MPVKSSHSSVLKWPDPSTVKKALKQWVDRVVEKHPEIRRIGYFGSYARGDWGVGSDLDLVAVVDDTGVPFERRASGWDLHELPVPADSLVYTEREWHRIAGRGGRFAEMLRSEVVWVYTKEIGDSRPFADFSG